jgi:phosphoglycerate dehydrogenase-like enzyme
VVNVLAQRQRETPKCTLGNQHGAMVDASAPETVLVTFPGFVPSDPAHSGALTDAGLGIRFAPKTGVRGVAEMADLVGNAVAAIVSTDPFDASVFLACPRLRVLARSGVGVDSIDLDAATHAGVVVTTTAGANDQAVADHTLALMLAAVRRIVEFDGSVRHGEWRRDASATAWDLHRATVGIVGLGSIGQAVARRLQGFGCVVIAYDIAPKTVSGVVCVSLGELLRRADIVTLHVPLSDSTGPLIGTRELELLREEAIIVNTSRGGVVDEAALYAALAEGRLRGAALDVFVDEPPVDSPLFDLPNVVLTPHIAGLSKSSIVQMLRLASQSILTVLDGGVPESVANPEVLAIR